MDQLISLSARALLFIYITLTATQQIKVIDQRESEAQMVLGLNPPSNFIGMCLSQTPPPFSDLKSFITGGGSVSSPGCGIDSASFILFKADTAKVNGIIRFCPFTIRRTYTIRDSCGGSASGVQTILIHDNTTPSVISPSNLIQCGNAVPPPFTSFASFMSGLLLINGSVTDNCGLDTSSFKYLGSDSIPNECLYTIERKYSIKDSCRNEAVVNQSYVVIDTILPTFTPARDTLIYVGGNCAIDTSIATIGIPTNIMDNCNLRDLSHMDIVKPGCTGLDTLYRIWTLTDLCGNEKIDTQFINVRDTANRIKITGPDPFTVLCASDIPAPDTSLIFATDACSKIKIKYFIKDSISDNFCLNKQTVNRIYTASNQCGASARFIQIIRVNDSIPPKMTCPSDFQVSCIAQVPIKNPSLATAVDSCDGVKIITVADSIIDLGCVNHQLIYRIYSTKDSCNNGARCIQLITVFDQTPPTLTCPAGMTVSCLSMVPPKDSTTVTASDNCTGALNVTFQKDSVVNPICVNKEVIYRFYQTLDACSNRSRCSQIFTINDTSAPTITCPRDTIVDCNVKVPNPDTSKVIAADNCTSPVSKMHLKDSVTGIVCVNNKIINRIYRASDECGNIKTCTQKITVLDTIPPLLNGPSNKTILTCGSPFTLVIPTASDNCPGSFAVTTTSRVIDSTCIGNKKVVYNFIAKDSCNNTTSRFDTVTYQDITPPVIKCPSDQLVDCTIPAIDNIDSFLLKGGMISDACGVDSSSFKLTKEVYIQSGNQIITTRTYKIADLCGNVDSCMQEITSPICFVDLALKKTINSKMSPFLVKQGGIVPFCITVYNQGFVTTDSIKIIEYFPRGGTIITSGWITNENKTACKYLSRANGELPKTGLLPGTSVQVCYQVQMSDTVRGGEAINIAEINEARDTLGNIIPDIDSKADNDPHNDKGGVPNSPDDDNISGNSNLGEDEDDADPALFFVLPEFNCINYLNASVSVDASCGHCFKASELLTGILLPDSLYKVTLFDSYGNKLPTNCVGREYLGYTITFSVTIPGINNSCWGTVKIEDKTPPQLDCKNDTIDCITYSYPLPIPTVYDNCSGRAEVTIVKELWTDLGCTGGAFAGIFTRTILAKDVWNNSTTCDKKYFIRKIDIDSVICAQDIVFECPDTLNIRNPLITGAPTYHNVKLWPLNPTCNLFMSFSDQRANLCGAGFKLFRTWIIGDVCTGKEIKCVQLIKVEDHTPPAITSLTHLYTIPSDPHECYGLLEVPLAGVRDCSSTIQSYIITLKDPEIPNKSKTLNGFLPAKIKFPKGVNKLYIDIHDDCNNYRRDSILVNVIDVTAPNPICHAETKVTLDPNECSAWITAKDFDNGSFDNCCTDLHFAAAYMNEIESTRANFISKLTTECGSKEYWENKAWYDAYIEEWINAYVFKDTVLVSECGTSQVVLRVYEACDLPRYDDHVFPCSPHAWYMYNTSWRYRVIFNQEFKKGGGQSCNVKSPWACKSSLMNSFDLLNSYSTSWYGSIPVYKSCDTLVSTGISEIACVRRLYNDCMIRLLADDKQKPHMDELPTLTVYCDGVNIPQGDSANSLCTTQGEKFGTNSNPWPGQIKMSGNDKIYGYYGGSLYPSHDEHQTLTEVCTDAQDAWSPIYCTRWLKLDSFETDTKVNPYDLFFKPVIKDKKHAAQVLKNNEFSVSDNCIVDSVFYIDLQNVNSCNQGWIQRTWTVKDKCGNTQTAIQKIIIKHRSDFEAIFPEDKIVNCENKSLADTGLTKAGLPILSDDDCEQLGIRYDDEIFYTELDACYKIVRTWTIIDWCIFDANQHTRNPDIIVNDTLRANQKDRKCTFRNIKDNNDGYMQYVQIIKIVDTERPKLKCEDKVICVTEGCSINVIVPLSGKDNCADTLYYRVDITYPDGSHDRRGNIQSITGVFAVGEYRVNVIGEDGCHNADTCDFILKIKDCKKPTPYCINGIATAIMPSTGSLVVWAKDLNQNSTDNCTSADKLIYSFSKNSSEQSHTYTCKDIKNGKEQTIPLEIWVTDEAGLQDYCSTYLLLQDNSENVCPDNIGATASIKGALTTEQKEPVEFASLSIKGSGTEGLPHFQTKTDGSYNFESLPLKGSYSVSAMRDDNPLNGVSTLDLVLIQKHILGTEKLNSPYKMIAADVDGSNSITAVDLIELRKLVLGIYDKLPNSTSWKFVPNSYQFMDASNPWGDAAGDRTKSGYPTEELIKEMSSDLVKDFVGIKIGDVNGSVIPHSLLGTEVRSNAHDLIFNVDDQKLIAGQRIRIAFSSPNFRGISGWQGTLSFGTMKFVTPSSGIFSGELQLSKGNIGNRWLDNGKVTMSWNETSGTIGASRDISEDKTLFELEFVPTHSGYLSDLLRFNSQHTIAESYEGKGETGNVSIQFRDLNTKGVIAKNFMDQNYPNPFNNKTVIGINLTQKCTGVLSVFDAAGRLLYTLEKDWYKGYNEIQLDRTQLGRGGLFYYKFQSNTFNDTKRMLLIE